MRFKFKSLHQFYEYFPDEVSCYKFLENQWWNDVPVCPHCGSIKTPYKVKSRIKFKDIPSYRCSEKGCDLPFTIRTGSVFEGSKVELRKWFHAIYEVTLNKKGISSIQLSEKIGVSQKTAWLMLHKIREMFKNTDNDKLDGTTEIDETFVGGKNKNRHWDKKVKNSQGRSFKDKTPVLGMFNRDTNTIRLFVIKDTSPSSVEPLIYSNISLASTVYTDEWIAYRDLFISYKHMIVRHGQGQYANGDVTTNRIENFWSILKRGIIGIYHYTSRKHLQRYCNEFCVRYNNKGKEMTDRFLAAVTMLMRGRVTYRFLTANIW